MRRDRRERVRIALLAMVAGVAILAQACGGGSTAPKETPTAKPLPTLPSGQETPIPRGGIGPGGGVMIISGSGSRLAEFLGISDEELQSELAAEDATLGTVAEAHGRTREELRTFLIQQIRTSADQEVANGRMSKDQADSLVQDLSTRVDDMIDGKTPWGGPAPPSEPGQ